MVVVVVVVRMLIFHGTPICNICIRLAVRVCREKKMQEGKGKGREREEEGREG